MADDEKTCSICYCIYCKKTLPQRYFLIIMMIIYMTITYVHRVCLSIAIINMTNWVEPSSEEPECKRSNKTSEKLEMDDEQFDWDESVQSYILLSFFIGYMISNLLIGLCMDLFGARWCTFGGSIMSGAATFIIPPLAYHTHWLCVCAARVITGLGQAPLFACTSLLISRWIPEENKSSAATTIFSSFTLGIVIGNIVGGYIMDWTRTWCWVFYIFGGVSLIWSTVFFFYIYNDPTTHPHVTEKEKKLLEQIPKPNKNKTPMRAILKDIPPWIFYFATFGSDFALYLIITNMPKYFAQVLGFSSTQTGIILIAPPLSGALGGAIFGLLGDYLIGKNILKKMTFRLILTTIGMPISAICLFVQVLFGCNVYFSAIMASLAMFFKAAFYGGVGMLAVDISLNYGGFLFGMCNFIAGASGVAAPAIVGAVAYQNTFAEWRLVQCITILVAVVTYIPCLMFMKVTRRDWDYAENEEKPPPDDAPVCKRIWTCYQME